MAKTFDFGHLGCYNWAFLTIHFKKMVDEVFLSHYKPQKNEKTLLNVLDNSNGQDFDILSNSKSLLLR